MSKLFGIFTLLVVTVFACYCESAFAETSDQYLDAEDQSSVAAGLYCCGAICYPYGTHSCNTMKSFVLYGTDLKSMHEKVHNDCKAANLYAGCFSRCYEVKWSTPSTKCPPF